MSVADIVRALVLGEPAARGGLLHTCRLEGQGGDAYGVEAIVDRMRRYPFTISPDAATVETPHHFALFDDPRAIVADVVDGRIARLWVLGPDRVQEHERGLAVPFDPDLTQAGAAVFVSAGDHPELTAGALSRVEALGSAIVTAASDVRTRAFAVRAFGSVDRGAALFALFRLRPAGSDVAGFTLAAAHWDGMAQEIVRDVAGEAALAAQRWRARIGE